MAHTNYQLAQGIGQLMPGNFVVPQNPVVAGFVSPSTAGMRAAHLAELMPGMFPVPQNPLIAALTASTPECAKGIGNPCSGLGAFDLASITSSMTDSLQQMDWTKWAMVGGGLLVLYYLMGRGGGDKTAYRRELKALRAKYPRRGARAYRAMQAAGEAY